MRMPMGPGFPLHCGKFPQDFRIRVMTTGRKGFHTDPHTWVKDLHGKRLHTVDMHAHIITPLVEKLVADRPQKKLELQMRVRTVGAPSVQHNNKVMMPHAMPALTSLPVRLDDMDQMGVDIQVISPLPAQYYYWAEPDLAEQIVTLQNEHVAAACAQHPGRLVGLGTLSLQHPLLAVAQLETAVRRLGLRGFELSTAVNDLELSDPSLEPVWATAQELGCVVFIHPQGCSLGERLAPAYLSNSVGQPVETAVALSHLIFGGVLDRYPSLKICAAYGGGHLPMSIGRSDHAFRTRPDAQTMRQVPSSYLRRIWFDSLVYSPAALRRLIDQVGVSQVVVGTDYPFDMGHYDIHGLVGGTPRLDSAELDAVLGGNAARLLQLHAP
jgi:aminocarboxymuconate-semialdehyde decarboxylase